MKKIFSLLLMVVMSVTLLAGCGSDPVYDDLENFLNVEMKEVNDEYTQVTAEVGTWETLEDDTAIKKSIDDTLLPLVNGSLEKLKDINPEIEEVKAIKDMIVLNNKAIIFNFGKKTKLQAKGFEGIQIAETGEDTLAVFLLFMNFIPKSEPEISENILQMYIKQSNILSLYKMQYYEDLNSKLNTII